ncbi:MAG: hypothetical protein QM743_04490 [Chitinophagaceae bacterium]
MIRLRLLLLLAFLSFLCCFLSWGNGAAGGTFAQLEYGILARGFRKDLLHPAILIPFTGQALLLYAVFCSRPRFVLTLSALLLCGLLAFFVLLINLLSHHRMEAASTLPYLSLSLYILLSRKQLWRS